MLEEAASAYRAALEARPADDAPLDTAKTQINLAYTLGALWNRTRNRQALDDALLAVEAALGLIEGVGGQEHIPAAKLARETMRAATGRGVADVRAAEYRGGGFDLARGVLLRSRHGPLRNTRRVQGMGCPLNRRQG